MRVHVLKDSGFSEALLGMSLSYYKGAPGEAENWFWNEYHSKSFRVATKLAPKDFGHNKFLRAINVWMLVEAPRYWWQEFDQYKVGVTSLSASTMHTLAKRPPRKSDFVAGTPWWTIALFRIQWELHRRNIQKLKKGLPESFIQTRVISFNYAALREIILQRHDHRLPEWQMFIHQVLRQVNNPELLPGYTDTEEAAK
jgi:hypothetical protein